eukprot:jgi/Chrpa1/7977/Chrysochromulina_OHIO_Genome00014958-RA
MPASARGPAKSSLPLQTRITPPSTPVLPLSPRKAARVQHLPQPLVPRLLCADQLRIATAALVNAHQPRSATAILANVPAPPAPTTLLEHLHPYPRPSSHRVRAEVACAELEQTMQAHYKHVKPPMMPGANSASAGTPRRSCTAGDGKRSLGHSQERGRRGKPTECRRLGCPPTSRLPKRSHQERGRHS